MMRHRASWERDPIGFMLGWAWGLICGLTLALIVSQAIGLINWSWWLVLSPMLIWLGVLGTLCTCIFFVLCLMLAMEE